MSPVSPSADLLLEQLHALAALARRLTRDPHAAADAVQDTMVAALTADVQRRGCVRAWLVAILRNVLRQRARAQSRRLRHEAQAVQERAAPSACDAASELATHRRVIELVQELPEPYRRTLFLRFWRGLSPHEIAALEQVPRKTVYTRIDRALERLRARLDAEHGRQAWLAALVPLQLLPGGWFGIGGLLLMKTKLIVGAVAALAVLALLPWLPTPGSVANADRSASVPAVPEAAGPRTASAPVATPREAVALPATQAARPEPATHGARFTGHVHDLLGEPVPGVAVVFEAQGEPGARVEAGPEAAISAADGTFQMPVPPAGGCLTTTSDRWATVRRPWLHGRTPPDEPPVVLVAPLRSYAGTVVDPAGLPVAGARVVVLVADTTVPVRLLGGKAIALPEDLAATDADARGRFTLPRVGFLAGARLTAERAPFTPARIELPEVSSSDVVLRLGPAREDRRRVHGLVLAASGVPVAAAEVSLGGAAARSDGDGRFDLPWPRKTRPTVVHAVAPDRGVASATLLPGEDQPGWRPDHPIVLRLPETPGEIRGRVVDHAGAPVAGARVWTPDLTYFGVIARSEQGHEITRDSSVEGLAAGVNEPLTVGATTAVDGTFVLRGLLPRPYDLLALDRHTLAAAGPIQATPGTAVELRLVRGTPRRVAGRVVSQAGKPLAAVRVKPGRGFAWQAPRREVDPWALAPTYRMAPGHVFAEPAVVTDAEGRFAFTGLEVERSFLALSGDAVFLGGRFELAPELDLEKLEVTVAARSRFQVQLTRLDEADAFGLRDTEDQHVTLLVRVEGFEMSMGRVDLVDGRSPQAASRAGEAFVVLYRQGVEVRRARVVLPEGGVHELRL